MSDKSQQQFDEKWNLPDIHRVDLDTAEARARLQSADEAQRELRDQLALSENSPQLRARQRALLTRREYEQTGNITLLPDTHKSILAAAYAELGDYNAAAAIEPDVHQKIDYDAILLAVHRDEADWCEHPKIHQYVERDVFSEKLGADAHLLKCNIPHCGFRNVAPLPETIRNQRRARRRSRERFAGLKPLEAKELAGIA